MSQRFLALLCTWLCVLAPTARADAPLATVDTLDVARYVGTWHQVAHFPNRFQARCVDETTAEYTALAAGRLAVRNRCRIADGTFIEARGVARRNAAYDRPGILQVRFAPAWLGWLPFVWGDYWIMALADDYGAVLVGTPDREYLWILARTPTLPDAQLAMFRRHAAAAGFDVDRLVAR
ncbi:MAG: lipocalin family protein [Gammaproteobacteria bacterium]